MGAGGWDRELGELEAGTLTGKYSVSESFTRAVPNRHIKLHEVILRIQSDGTFGGKSNYLTGKAIFFIKEYFI